MGRNAVGYELAATRLLNRGRKMSADDEQRAHAEVLIAAANAFAILDLASAIRGQQAGDDAEVAAVSADEESPEADDVAAEDEEPDESVAAEKD